MNKIGVIADDFTGATDIAGFMVANGISTIQTNGIPSDEFIGDADAYVVSLKSRSCPKEEAIKLSLDSLKWLQSRGCTQIYFKYCSTFDSTSDGNIGPVTDALMEALNTKMTIICPALPVNGRTIYKGYLFVFDQLLSESGMKNHPVTPMTDSKISRVMENQSAGRADNLYAEVLDQGAEAVRSSLNESEKQGYSYVVMDSLSQTHLDIIAEAVDDMPLVTGGSGLVAGLARLDPLNAQNKMKAMDAGRPERAKTVIFSGSCSTATNRQVELYKEKAESMQMDVDQCMNNEGYPEELFEWILPRLEKNMAPLLYATVAAQELSAIQMKYKESDIGAAIETVFSSLAVKLRDAGVKKFIIAGGETSGRIVQNLGISAFYIGPQIDPGVPWVKAVDQNIFLALKSGNFGAADFFSKAQEEFV